jgi:N-acetylmuramoyl-L-alanine amidase
MYISLPGMEMTMPRAAFGLLVVALLVVGCAGATVQAPVPTQPIVVAHVPPAPTVVPAFSPSMTPSLSPALTPVPPATPTLLARLVAVDAGHGGVDLGAVVLDSRGRVVVTEADVNLALALRLAPLLEARGYRVLLTRDGNYSLNEEGLDINGDGRVDPRDDLQARIDLVNDAGVDLFLSIHQNAYYRQGGRAAPNVGGTVTFYCAHRPFSADSLRFANEVQQALVNAFNELGHNVHDRGAQEDLVLVTPNEPGTHLVLLGPQTERIARPSEMPAVLSEALFLTHTQEARLAQNPAVLDRLALAYADAVDAYFGQPPSVASGE